MYVDEIPKQYMVSKFWASITNMGHKKNTYLSKRPSTFFQLKYRKELQNLLDIVSNIFLTCLLWDPTLDLGKCILVLSLNK